MIDGRQEQPQAGDVAATPDPFSDLETERLMQEIARLYVLLAETLGAPLGGR